MCAQQMLRAELDEALGQKPSANSTPAVDGVRRQLGLCGARPVWLCAQRQAARTGHGSPARLCETRLCVTHTPASQTRLPVPDAVCCMERGCFRGYGAQASLSCVRASRLGCPPPMRSPRTQCPRTSWTASLPCLWRWIRTGPGWWIWTSSTASSSWNGRRSRTECFRLWVSRWSDQCGQSRGPRARPGVCSLLDLVRCVALSRRRRCVRRDQFPGVRRVSLELPVPGH